MSAESKWKIVNGAMESVPGSGYIVSKQKFGDCQVHVEFASPQTVKGSGQGRGNSGVFLMGEFEVQVLDDKKGRRRFRASNYQVRHIAAPKRVSTCI